MTAQEEIFTRVRLHRFHPLNEEHSMTRDRTLEKAGIGDLDDPDWRVRLLAIRDLVRAGEGAAPQILRGLADENPDVRQVCAAALGVLGAEAAAEALERTVRQDANGMVRSQAVIALGQIQSEASLGLLGERQQSDPSRDVRYQCELAADQIRKRSGATDELRAAFESLDEERFESVKVGEPAADFTLPDTEGVLWRLSANRGNGWVVLIWVFADWCPVCHGEFRELMEMRQAFEREGIRIFTLECHDRYRGRVMVGKELEPQHWFAEKPFKEAYTKGIWWPHLLDRAGAVGAVYGVDPLAFAVHSEYINRPATVIVDPEGIVRFAYYGTYWGDRPSIEQTLDMVREQRFDFVHPERLPPADQ